MGVAVTAGSGVTVRWRRRSAIGIAIVALVIAAWALFVPSVDRSYACDPVVFGGGPAGAPVVVPLGGSRVCAVEPEIALAGASIVVALLAVALARNERLLSETEVPGAALGRRSGGPLARSLLVVLLGLGLAGSVAVSTLAARASSVCSLAMLGIASPPTDPDLGPQRLRVGPDGTSARLIEVRTDTATVRETVWERENGSRYATRLERQPDGSWFGGYVCL